MERETQIQNYIVTLEPQEQFNINSESLGMSDKLAVFYSYSIGRRRYYRQSILNPQKGLKLLTFKTEKAAQQVCEEVNKYSGGGWRVESQAEEEQK